MGGSDASFLRILLEHPNLDLNVPGFFLNLTPLAITSYSDEKEECAALLLKDPRCKLKVSVDGVNCNVLFHVINSNTAEMVRLFLSHGCDPNAKQVNSDYGGLCLNVLEENMLNCTSTKITKIMKKKVKMGRLLMEAGCRPRPIPYEVRVILEEKLNSETRFASTKELRKNSIARFEALGKQIQTLAQLSGHDPVDRAT